jgi:hypothetical protein
MNVNFGGMRLLPTGGPLDPEVRGIALSLTRLQPHNVAVLVLDIGYIVGNRDRGFDAHAKDTLLEAHHSDCVDPAEVSIEICLGRRFVALGKGRGSGLVCGNNVILSGGQGAARQRSNPGCGDRKDGE